MQVSPLLCQPKNRPRAPIVSAAERRFGGLPRHFLNLAAAAGEFRVEYFRRYSRTACKIRAARIGRVVGWGKALGQTTISARKPLLSPDSALLVLGKSKSVPAFRVF